MSLGVNLLMKLLKDAVATLQPAGFDVEIVEKHHRMKLDAPSGTALALADAINEAAVEPYEYVYDRSGTIVGDHDVIFAGEDEVTTFSHMAYSRAVFAKGALAAAKFLAGKAPGLYDMSDVIGG